MRIKSLKKHLFKTLEGILESKRKMGKREYNKQDVIALMVASGGRCHICNNDIMTDWRSHKDFKTAELAHIKSISDIGPRADETLSIEDRNSTSNLLVLCPTCHATIDKKYADGIYTVDWLLRKKENKNKLIRYILEKLNDEECLFVKYNSVIDVQNSNFTDQSINIACFENGFFSKEGIVNLSEDLNYEDISQSMRMLNDKFTIRIQRLFDNGIEKTICLFAQAPQPLLMYLGHKFNDKHKIEIFTSHRNMQWKYNDMTSVNSFTIEEPKKRGKVIALALNVTASISDERISSALGEDIEIWRITSADIGVDKISNQVEMKKFYTVCVEVFDKIGLLRGKDVEINVFSAVCNSLAITFGRAVFVKCHNKINIYDAVKIDGTVKDVYRLSI